MYLIIFDSIDIFLDIFHLYITGIILYLLPFMTDSPEYKYRAHEIVNRVRGSKIPTNTTILLHLIYYRVHQT